jgi:hypothetical protein
MSDPGTSVSEQLEIARKRRFDAEIALARAELRGELADARSRAAHAEAEAAYLRRRGDELEAALGRRQRARQDASQGIARFRSET